MAFPGPEADGQSRPVDGAELDSQAGLPDDQQAMPSSVSEAARMALAGLGWLASAGAAALPGPALAECLRRLEEVLAVHTAARARILGAFAAQRMFEDDGQGSARTWLTWQTRITRPAASAAAGGNFVP